MIGLPDPTSSRTAWSIMVAVVFVAGAVLLAFSIGVLVLTTLAGDGRTGDPRTGDGRTIEEVYNYHLSVRVRDPGATAELWVPVPDFGELKDRVTIHGLWPEFPNQNVTQSLVQSDYGTMFRFRFSESFAAGGEVRGAPGFANGTLTLNSQVSNRVWIFLANVSSNDQVSVILFYEAVQIRDWVGFEPCSWVSFVGTAEPPAGGGPVLRAGYLHRMVRDENAYVALSPDWNGYSLVDGRFEVCGT